VTTGAPRDADQAIAVESAARRRPFFTPRTLAEYLAVDRRTVYAMLARGTLPSYKVEGLRRIAAEDVDAYLAERRDPQPGRR
jgi:excisionase family DNA binding protein